MQYVLVSKSPSILRCGFGVNLALFNHVVDFFVNLFDFPVQLMIFNLVCKGLCNVVLLNPLGMAKPCQFQFLVVHQTLKDVVNRSVTFGSGQYLMVLTGFL